MQTTTVGTPRNHSRHLWVIGAVLALVLTGATIVAVVAIRWGESEAPTTPAPVAGDLTTLALDRDGADLFPPVVGAAPDTTSLNLDRVGADTLPRLLHDSPEITALSLGLDGSDDTNTPTHRRFFNPSTDHFETAEWTYGPGHPGFSDPWLRLVDKQ
jgi:hypothetical protein